MPSKNSYYGETRIPVKLSYDKEKDILFITRPGNISYSTKQNKKFSADYDKNGEIVSITLNNFSEFLLKEWSEQVSREEITDVNGASEIIINEPKTIVVFLGALDGIIKLHEQ